MPYPPTQAIYGGSGLAKKDDYVPYTGATQDVDLGTQNLTTTGIGTFGEVALGDDKYIYLGSTQRGRFYHKTAGGRVIYLDAETSAADSGTIGTGYDIRAGYGGASTSALVNGARGGALRLYSGNGGNNTQTGATHANAGDGGALVIQSGAGGAAFSADGDAGAGDAGAYSVRVSDGGLAYASGAGSAVGGYANNISFSGGSGGLAAIGGAGAAIGGNGSDVIFSGGTGGNAGRVGGSGGTTGGEGGQLRFIAGLGGTGDVAGANGDILFQIGTGNTKVQIAGNNLYQPGDNFKHVFGAGSDASIYYDGTNMIINPKNVGSGILDVLGTLQTDGYNAADGTAGATGTITLASVTTITVKNGLITAWA